MTRKKKSIREPALEQDVRKNWQRLQEGLHPDYNEFMLYKKNRDVKDSTLTSWIWKFKGFPDPDNLNTEHFETRLVEVSKKTVRFELTLARMFLKWSKRTEQLEELQEFDIGKVEKTITEDDIYTAEELTAIFQSAENTRDRAMLQVLYESGFRASELLSMTCEGIRAGKRGMIEVKCHESKTKERWVVLDMSVPALQEWRESHPFKQGALWVTRRKKTRSGKTKGEYEPISYIGFYHIVNKALQNAGIQGKKRIVHLFRHTRITQLRTEGMQGIPLHSYVGWTPGSNMEKVYVHMNGKAVIDQFYRSQGVDEDEPVKPLFSKRVCICGTENDPSRGYCISCNRALTPELQALEEKTDLEEQVATLETAYTDLHKKHTEIQEFVKKEVQQEIAKEQARGLAGASVESLVRLFHALATKPKKETDAFIKMLKDTKPDKSPEQILQAAYEFLDKEYGTTVIDGVIHVDKSKPKKSKKIPKKQSKKEKPKNSSTSKEKNS